MIYPKWTQNLRDALLGVLIVHENRPLAVRRVEKQTRKKLSFNSAIRLATPPVRFQPVLARWVPRRRNQLCQSWYWYLLGSQTHGNRVYSDLCNRKMKSSLQCANTILRVWRVVFQLSLTAHWASAYTGLVHRWRHHVYWKHTHLKMWICRAYPGFSQSRKHWKIWKSLCALLGLSKTTVGLHYNVRDSQSVRNGLVNFLTAVGLIVRSTLCLLTPRTYSAFRWRQANVVFTTYQ
jgi:hypothetical protein